MKLCNMNLCTSVCNILNTATSNIQIFRKHVWLNFKATRSLTHTHTRTYAHTHVHTRMYALTTHTHTYAHTRMYALTHNTHTHTQQILSSHRCWWLRMSKVIYSCAENEFKIFICSNNGNTLRYSLAKAYILSDLFVHQQNIDG